jgi:hypothetical protein
VADFPEERVEQAFEWTLGGITAVFDTPKVTDTWSRARAA